MENSVKGLSNGIAQISDLEDKSQEIYQNLEQKYMELENIVKKLKDKRDQSRKEGNHGRNSSLC